MSVSLRYMKNLYFFIQYGIAEKSWIFLEWFWNLSYLKNIEMIKDITSSSEIEFWKLVNYDER